MCFRDERFWHWKYIRKYSGNKRKISKTRSTNAEAKEWHHQSSFTCTNHRQKRDIGNQLPTPWSDMYSITCLQCNKYQMTQPCNTYLVLDSVHVLNELKFGIQLQLSHIMICLINFKWRWESLTESPTLQYTSNTFILQWLIEECRRDNAAELVCMYLWLFIMFTKGITVTWWIFYFKTMFIVHSPRCALKHKHYYKSMNMCNITQQEI